MTQFHSTVLRYDFDMNLYACASVRACLRAHVCASEIYHGKAPLSQTSASLLPGVMAYSSIPTG